MAIKNIPVERPLERLGLAAGSGKTVKVMFRPLNVTVQAHEGQTVLEVCEANQIPLEHNCGGNCACSTCHVIVRNGLDALSPADDDELDQLDEVEGLTLASRLGCQTKIFGDTEVEIPPQKHASGPATSDSELALTSR